ncbi:hypothetical protein OTB20_19610 [Streptomyces sp. H27-H1]|uniref:hypothetical protein n=1 Tax=Streptomyces sp. H27-H1 TaxID=2996461 RepID=UPI00226EC1BE|nr:hypothetical protein [Streptomyces sp. H27-H1]MCY0928365.1 hypothetical protein [Streptomyces sp. H27-H1]
MSFRPVTSFIVVCDICLRAMETGDHVALFALSEEGEAEAVAAGWTQLREGGTVCPREDVSHRLASHQQTTEEVPS